MPHASDLPIFVKTLSIYIMIPGISIHVLTYPRPKRARLQVVWAQEFVIWVSALEIDIFDFVRQIGDGRPVDALVGFALVEFDANNALSVGWEEGVVACDAGT